MSSDRRKGFAVVSVTEGLTLGHVAAALCDPDAIVVASSRATRPTTAAVEYVGLVELDALTHRKVVDAAGTLLGTLRDLAVDLTTGAPLRLTVHQGGFLGCGGETATIAGAAIRSVGGDLITVDERVPVAAPDIAAVAASLAPVVG